jgi:hypothetical protein
MEHRVATRRASSACLALGLLVVGCTGSTTQPDETPVYTGTTCAELAQEWGEEVDRRITAIIDGPDVVNDQAKSAQNTDALVLASTAMSVHMDHLGLLNECDMPEFLPMPSRSSPTSSARKPERSFTTPSRLRRTTTGTRTCRASSS